jgi:hypothetical protein
VADQVYQPIVSDDDDQSETPSPTTDLPIESWSDYRASLEEGTDRSALTTEEAANTRRRQPDPESPESAYERPITVHKVKGGGELSLNEAADNIHFSRAKKLGADLREAGFSEAQLNEMSADALERAQRLDPKIPPPPEVKGLDEFGREDDGPLSVDEAAKQLTDWRQRHQEAQQAELQEMIGEAAAAAAQQAQPQPEPQQQQPQPQPTPEQTERQKIAAERQQLIALKRIEGVEASWRHNYDQLRAEVEREFPGLPQATAADVEQLRVQDPARFQKLVQYDAALKDRQQKIAVLTQLRGQQERQQAQINAQARAAARAEQDRAFEQLATQHIPNWESNHGQIRQQARTTLENAGLSQEEIHHLWNGDHSIDAHSSVLQLILAKAAQWDLAQERARQVRQAPVPPVMRPGTYRARDDGAQSVRELSARLDRASGREALRLGTALTRAKRAAMDGG